MSTNHFKTSFCFNYQIQHRKENKNRQSGKDSVTVLQSFLIPYFPEYTLKNTLQVKGDAAVMLSGPHSLALTSCHRARYFCSKSWAQTPQTANCGAYSLYYSSQGSDRVTVQAHGFHKLSAAAMGRKLSGNLPEDPAGSVHWQTKVSVSHVVTFTCQGLF